MIAGNFRNVANGIVYEIHISVIEDYRRLHYISAATCVVRIMHTRVELEYKGYNRPPTTVNRYFYSVGKIFRANVIAAMMSVIIL